MTELRNVKVEVVRFRRRLLILALVMLAAFGLVVARLVVLQVARHDDLEEQAENNSTAVLPIVPNRGEIFDRNGVVLATNYKTYTLEITPSKLDRPLDQVIDAIAQLVDVTPLDRKRFARARADARNFDSVPLRLRLTDAEVARFAAQAYRFPGVEIKARLMRTYPLGLATAHVVGYIGRINQTEQDRIDDSDDADNYRGTDYIGKLGIESSYESLLHGATGFQVMETAASGQAVRELTDHPATPGDSLRLTLDIKLQQLVEQLYGNRRGALVAIDPRNSEVLAFVSQPSFDPNLFVDGIGQDDWDALNGSPDKPLLNRALRGAYPPGSTYKPFMALAALEGRYRTPAQIVVDRGSWTFGGHVFRSSDGPLGALDMAHAIMKSSDVYFYQLANDMGVNAIHDFMAPLGLGQLTGIDLPGEVRGVLPSTQWKHQTFKRPAQQKWYAGETISLGIGQGYNSFTMLQMASALSTLVDGGVRHVPHLVRERLDPVSQKWTPMSQPPGRNMGYHQANLSVVRNAMIGVTQQGTSRAAFVGAPYLSGGKTGTAQVITIGQKSHYNAARIPERYRDHSLYIAFAPADNPTIAIACIVENAGWGAGAAAPLVRRVLDYWIAGRYPSDEAIKAIQQGHPATPGAAPRRADAPASAEAVQPEDQPPSGADDGDSAAP
ncbi:MAG: penicillin-binding protein 2 [Burkholderiaceae bacterium]|jgi:penicillin-binding protein 2|nr:penicillin-binding protein 2 [Burkholderiaceae bacterium]